MLGNEGGEVSSFMGLLIFWYSDSRAGINVGIEDGYRSELLLVYSHTKAIKSTVGRIVTATNPFLCIFSRYSSFFLVLVRDV